jgi:hypothetical protein
MNSFTKITSAMAFVGAVALASPSYATVETFASFTQVRQGNSLNWVKTNTGGRLYTTSTSTGNTPGAVSVNFSFLSDRLANVGQLATDFTMDLVAASGNAAFNAGGYLVQGGLTGSFSFIYTGSGFTIGDTFYGKGTNLLSGTLGGTTIGGAANASSGGVSASSSNGSPISYTSDVLSFTQGSNYDFALSLTQINDLLNRPNANSSLRNFRAASTGSFSSDPQPAIIALPVPEAATWAFMLVGFGVIGSALRVRRSSDQLVNI